MNRKENIFLAKKLFTELVFNTAYIEGVNVTFPQTQAIIDGAVVNNIAVSDIQTILNLRDGWKYALDTLDEPLNLKYICQVNQRISRNESLEWGVLRNGNVGISGTEYVPPIPDTDTVNTKLAEINAISDPKERATEYFCYAVRGQLFWDGNKRTSTIISSKILIEAGAGVLTIGKSNAVGFNEALQHLYNTGDKTPLKKCLNQCIKTLDVSIKKDKEQDIEESKPSFDKTLAQFKTEAAQLDKGKSTQPHTKEHNKNAGGSPL